MPKNYKLLKGPPLTVKITFKFHHSLSKGLSIHVIISIAIFIIPQLLFILALLD